MHNDPNKTQNNKFLKFEKKGVFKENEVAQVHGPHVRCNGLQGL